jgi:hypothetical protein
MHKTDNLEDGYMGSGKLIKAAITKYGLENFIKDILFVFDNESEMKSKEKELVILGENSYNLVEGGHGGFGFINRERLNSGITSENSRNNLKRGDNPIKLPLDHYIKMTSIRKENHPNGTWHGKKHTEETKLKLRKTKNVGQENSQYGTMWVTDGKQPIKIRKEQFDEFKLKGYNKGRK